MPELQEFTEGEKARIYDEVVWKIRILVLVVLILLAAVSYTHLDVYKRQRLLVR